MTKRDLIGFVDEPAAMAGPHQRIVPTYPHYSSNGNEVIEQWLESFTDRVGNEATITWVKFKTPKGKVSEVVARVHWTKLFAYLD